MVDERIARRRRQVRRERKRARLHRTVLVVVLLGIAVALLVVERSPLVAISEVRVEGTQALAPDDVVAASGIRTGTSLLRVDLDAAVDRVRALPLVADAEIVRSDPLTIEISVRERQPAYVARNGIDEVVLDDDGVALGTDATAGLVPISVEAAQLPEPGTRADPVSALGNAIAVAEGLPGALTTRAVAHEGLAPDRAVVVLDDGTRVEFGRAENLAAKSRALAAVLDDLAGRSVTSIDVRSSTNPIINP